MRRVELLARSRIKSGMGKALLAVALSSVALVAPFDSNVIAAASTRPSATVSIDRLLTRWRPRLEREHFNWVEAGPFLVAGDLPKDRLLSWRDGTILPATNALQSAYFKTPPSEPTLILLFGSDESYRRLAKEWFSDADVSHFGYFRHDGVMLMNITTGGGTLVHEMVHALSRPDFPACPDWLNEGLGSLYEQCTLNPLLGLPNWRLAGLQEAVRSGSLRPIPQMIESPDFYARSTVGINYAHARYLLLYLQEKDLLRAFYKAARDRHETDPTGLESLQAVIAPETLEDFERDWREWVLALRFP